MMQRQKLIALLRDAHRKPIAFRDSEKLLKIYGFTHHHTTGSHRQYTHSKVPRPFPVQPDGKEAKLYQVREFLALIGQFDLHMEV